MAFSTSSIGKNKLLKIENRKEFMDRKVLKVPDLLQTLVAFQYYEKSERACTAQESVLTGARTPLSYSDCSTPLSQIRSAMLLILMALPQGCIDDQDDRWADDFITPWRESVLSGPDCTSLMQSQVMLEFGIKTGWYTPGGLKLMSSLPSRSHSLRFPSLGLLALRVWSLDQAIRYQKVVLPGEKATGGSANRGRPKGVGNNPSGSRKKKKTY